eukprot:TRINITY_DN2461_c0_g1_i5.p1 TRINITY_DN2461_c0_g1~~TRINITY_DN2461_c0_g1_i5.p1  ORF type:complete len:100 (+),score=21.61 TRINITY_DN2461_c0_g1_i5:144-443(+)
MQEKGEMKGTPVDLKDGYIHLSSQSECRLSAQMYYAEVEEPVVLRVQYQPIAHEVKWEFAKSRNAEFPHLYRPLKIVDISDSFIISKDFSGHFIFPSDF